MSVYILDSNIISFYIRQEKPIVDKVQETLLAGHQVLVGPIAYYEVKRGLQAINATKRLREFAALCKVLGVGKLDNSLLDYASDIYCELRQKKQTVEDADILTAALCIKHDFILVTNNTEHFENISGLRYCDWKK